MAKIKGWERRGISKFTNLWKNINSSIWIKIDKPDHRSSMYQVYVYNSNGNLFSNGKLLKQFQYNTKQESLEYAYNYMRRNPDG